MHKIALFGGTFDPIHNGHIKTSLSIQHSFHFDEYYFIPCKNQVLKPEARASNQQRIQMLNLAVNFYPQFSIDLCEMERDSPSYTLNTLTHMRQQWPDAAITLILGYDSFLSLPQWYHWQELITLANILVINRDNYRLIPLSKPLEDFLQQYQTLNKEDFLSHTLGAVYFFNAGNYQVSSSEIRKKISEHVDVSTLLPENVYQFIKDEGLYL
ncbi:MAG: nicotinate-nucleotide adenylyltransferase [Legionella sp.]|nr:nicotinate-nucleotide adenylyltransferase [Legionella sp.]